LEKATAALRSGELIDDLITELGTGGLTRVAELYGTSAARMSGWRKSAPAGVDEITLLKVAWLQASSLQDPEQAGQADSLVDLIGNVSKLPFVGAVVGMALASAFANQASKMSDRIPIKVAMAAARDTEAIVLGNDAVPPRVPTSSRIVFMGEAPGAAEAISGLPFVGPSGMLLMNTIREAEGGQTLGAEKIGFTNVFQARPPDNKVSEYFGSAKSEDTASDLPRCLYGHLLISQLPALQLNATVLAEAKPLVIVALGAVAAWALLGRYDISNFRGTFTTVDYGPFQAKVMATYHPAYVLRDRRRLEAFTSDITAAVEQMRKG
jgi:DNA polymerase